MNRACGVVLILAMLSIAIVAYGSDQCESSHLALVSMRINPDNGLLDTKWQLSIVSCQKPKARGVMLYHLMCPNFDGQMESWMERRLVWDTDHPTSMVSISDSVSVPSEECRAADWVVESCWCFEMES